MDPISTIQSAITLFQTIKGAYDQYWENDKDCIDIREQLNQLDPILQRLQKRDSLNHKTNEIGETDDRVIEKNLEIVEFSRKSIEGLCKVIKEITEYNKKHIDPTFLKKLKYMGFSGYYKDQQTTLKSNLQQRLNHLNFILGADTNIVANNSYENIKHMLHVNMSELYESLRTLDVLMDDTRTVLNGIELIIDKIDESEQNIQKSVSSSFESIKTIISNINMDVKKSIDGYRRYVEDQDKLKSLEIDHYSVTENEYNTKIYEEEKIQILKTEKYHKHHIVLKYIHIDSGEDQDKVNDEMLIMKELCGHHDHLLRFYGYHNEPQPNSNKFIIVQHLEYAEFGTVVNYFNNNNITKVDPTVAFQILNWGLELISVIRYIHRHDIIHNNIIESNVLLDRNLRIKLCGFSHAINLKKSGNRYAFHVPSDLKNSHHVLKSGDVHSWGKVIMLFLLRKELSGTLTNHLTECESIIPDAYSAVKDVIRDAIKDLNPQYDATTIEQRISGHLYPRTGNKKNPHHPNNSTTTTKRKRKGNESSELSELYERLLRKENRESIEKFALDDFYNKMNGSNWKHHRQGWGEHYETTPYHERGGIVARMEEDSTHHMITGINFQPDGNIEIRGKFPRSFKNLVFLQDLYIFPDNPKHQRQLQSHVSENQEDRKLIQGIDVLYLLPKLKNTDLLTIPESYKNNCATYLRDKRIEHRNKFVNVLTSKVIVTGGRKETRVQFLNLMTKCLQKKVDYEFLASSYRDESMTSLCGEISGIKVNSEDAQEENRNARVKAELRVTFLNIDQNDLSRSDESMYYIFENVKALIVLNEDENINSIKPVIQKIQKSSKTYVTILVNYNESQFDKMDNQFKQNLRNEPISTIISHVYDYKPFTNEISPNHSFLSLFLPSPPEEDNSHERKIYDIMERIFSDEMYAKSMTRSHLQILDAILYVQGQRHAIHDQLEFTFDQFRYFLSNQLECYDLNSELVEEYLNELKESGVILTKDDQVTKRVEGSIIVINPFRQYIYDVRRSV